MDLDSVTVNIELPWIGSGISGTWKPNDAEKRAAWEMYVELSTRITLVELGTDEGILREALNSYHSLFQSTRDTLKRGGPELIKSEKGELNFGIIALRILNEQLRPLLNKWHPLLMEYEKTRPEHVSINKHEKAWSENKALRVDIESTRKVLIEYANLLAQIIGIDPDLHESK